MNLARDESVETINVAQQRILDFAFKAKLMILQLEDEIVRMHAKILIRLIESMNRNCYASLLTADKSVLKIESLMSSGFNLRATCCCTCCCCACVRPGAGRLLT